MRRLVVYAVSVGLFLSAIGTALAQDSALLIGMTAKLIEGGQAVLVEVDTLCPESSEAVQTSLVVTQGSVTSAPATFTVVCDGTMHAQLVRVAAPEGSVFRAPAKAFATATLELSDGETLTASRGIKIR
jgi:hypothetical protein